MVMGFWLCRWEGEVRFLLCLYVYCMETCIRCQLLLAGKHSATLLMFGSRHSLLVGSCLWCEVLRLRSLSLKSEFNGERESHGESVATGEDVSKTTDRTSIRVLALAKGLLLTGVDEAMTVAISR